MKKNIKNFLWTSKATRVRYFKYTNATEKYKKKHSPITNLKNRWNNARAKNRTTKKGGQEARSKWLRTHPHSTAWIPLLGTITSWFLAIPGEKGYRRLKHSSCMAAAGAVFLYFCNQANAILVWAGLFYQRDCGINWREWIWVVRFIGEIESGDKRPKIKLAIIIASFSYFFINMNR